MDYSELSVEALKFELRELFDRVHGLRFMLANYEDENGYESYDELQGQITGCEQLIEEIEAEIKRRES